MQQLTGLDAMFLYGETSNAPTHIAPLFIYDPSTAPGGFVRFKDILRTFEQRLHLSPVFTRKLMNVPLNLDHPFWIEDDQFDLEFHVRHIALPKPGDWRQLCIQIARLHARPLDRSRPLWEAYVIEGLDNIDGLPKGCFALYLKIHHAAIDGASGVDLQHVLHDMSADLVVDRTIPSRRKTEAAPGKLALLRHVAKDVMFQPLGVVRLIGDAIPAFRRIREGLKKEEFRSLDHKERTRFNDRVSPHRVFAAVEWDLADVSRIRKSVENATVNDVILTIASGALREYLLSKNELPEHSLVVAAPVNIREPDDKEIGNKVSMMSIAVHTEIDDPLERLKQVHNEAVNSKAYLKAMGARKLTDWTNMLPAQIAAYGSRAVAASGLMAQAKPVFNTAVTNVPGPQHPLYLSGARMVHMFGAGPIMDGLGLFHAVGSYAGKISISVQACREMMPDPQFYQDCLEHSMARLSEAAIKPRRKVEQKKSVGAKVKTKTKTKAKAKAKAKAQAKPVAKK